ncbi:MAG: hypothetical protein LBM93_02910 [Oscillospiraceae bacterium]|jgi:hypothetical protein|nr:hypothetical protein [Oscillospiraceae bacterium]
MNFYPTRYNELSNQEVNELYRSETWSELSRNERLDALQELENRSSEELGIEPCEVRLEHMEGATYGGYNDGVIYLNENLVENGEFSVTFEDGTTQSFKQEDVNAQLMDTIHHENYHSYQDNAIHGMIEHDNTAEVEQWRANWAQENYIDGNDPEHCYRLQSLEKTAFEHGEANTTQAFDEIQTKYGEDAGYQSYLENINEYSYENELEQAKSITGDENIEQTVNQRIMDNYQANQATDFSDNTLESTHSVQNADEGNVNDAVNNTPQITDEFEDCL